NPSGTVDLRARSTGDNVTVDNQGFVNLTSTNTAGITFTLKSFGGSISQTDNSVNINAPAVVLTTTGGNIGSGSQRIITVAANSSLSADATTAGDVNVEYSNNGATISLTGTNRANNYNLLVSSGDSNIQIGAG